MFRKLYFSFKAMTPFYFIVFSSIFVIKDREELVILSKTNKSECLQLLSLSIAKT